MIFIWLNGTELLSKPNILAAPLVHLRRTTCTLIVRVGMTQIPVAGVMSTRTFCAIRSPVSC
jgi:hypothetical protein